MFDVGFNEILFIALVALIVLGPKRLPEVARTLGFWLSKMRRTLRDFKDEVDAEVRKSTIAELQSLQRDNLSQEISDLGKEIRSSFEATAEASPRVHEPAQAKTRTDAQSQTQLGPTETMKDAGKPS